MADTAASPATVIYNRFLSTLNTFGSRLNFDGDFVGLVDRWVLVKTAVHSDGAVEFWVFFRMLNWRTDQSSFHYAHIVKAEVIADTPHTVSLTDSDGRRFTASASLGGDVCAWAEFQRFKESDPEFYTDGPLPEAPGEDMLAFCRTF